MNTHYTQKNEFKHKKYIWITEIIIFGLFMLIVSASSAQTPRITYSHYVDITSKSPTFEKEVNLNDELSTIQDIEFNPDGTKMFVLSLSGSIFQYSLAIPFDISTASYDDVSIDKGDVSIIPVGAMTGIDFGQEGMLLYVSFFSGHVSQITLANPYNLSSFTSSGEASKVIAGTAILQDIQISSDGRNLFALNDQELRNYSLGTPFDLESRFLLGDYDVDEETFPTSLFLFSSGSQLMIVGGDGDAINQYSLSSYSHSSISFNGSPFDVSSETVFPKSIFVDPKGRSLFIAGNSSVFSYTLTPGDSYNENIDNDGLVEGQIRINLENAGEGFIVPEGLDRLMTEGTHFTIHNKPEGLTPQMSVAADGQSIILSFANNAMDNSHSADISNLRFSFTNEAFQTLSASEIENAIFGNSFLGIDFIGNPELRYTAPIDIISESPIHNDSPFSVADNESAPSGLAFDPSGNNLFVLGEFGVTQYLLEDVPFETSEISSTEGTLSIVAQTTTPSDILFDPSGTRMFILDQVEAAIFQYTLYRPFDIFSAEYNQISFSVTDGDGEPTGMAFNNTGSKLFVIGNGTKEIAEYTLDNAFDLSSNTSLNNTSTFVSTVLSHPQDLVFDATGSKVLVLDSDSDRIHQFSLNVGSGFNIAAGSYDGSFSVIGQEFNGTGLALHPKGTHLYMIGSDADEINQYSLKDLIFKENESNDGSVLGSLSIRLDDDGFSGEGSLASSAYSIPNLPEGLTPLITLENSRNGILTLNGQAESNAHNHETADDISDLTFQFFNFAFTSSNASRVVNATNASSGFGIDFDENPIQDQVITFDDPGDQVFGENFVLSAAASSGLPISFSVIEGPIEITGNQVDITGAGTAIIAANQSGNENYNPAEEVTRTITINKAFQSINFPEIIEKTFGDQFLLEATASSGLPVEYSIDKGSAEIINENELLITGVGDGEIIVIARQAGNENYHPVLGVDVSFEVFKADQSIVFLSLSAKMFGDVFELEATTTSGLGVVYSVVNGPISIEGSTVTVEGSGIAKIAADQPGNENYNSAERIERSFLIPSMDQVITFEPIPNKLTTDPPFEFVASISSGLPLEFNYSGPIILENNTVTLTGEAGIAIISISHPGGQGYNPTSENVIFTVSNPEKTNQTITVEPIPNKLTIDEPFEVVATSSSGLTLMYLITNGPATIIDNTITLTGETGIVEVTVSQAGNETFNPAEENVTFNVTDAGKIDQTITFNQISDVTYGDADFELSASASSGLPISFTILTGPISIEENIISINGVGTVKIAANQSGNDDFNPAPEATVTFEIAKADQLILITGIADKLITDDPFDIVAAVDSALELVYEVSGPASISGNTVTLNGEVGTVEVIVSQEGNENHNSASESISFNVSEEQALSVGDEIQLKIYPNPVVDFLRIESEQTTTIRIFNLEGQLVRSENVNNGQLDLSNLSSGMYLLETELDGKLLKQKIIKAN